MLPPTCQVDMTMRNKTRFSFDASDTEFQNPLEVIKKDKIQSIEILGGKQSQILMNDLRLSINHENKRLNEQFNINQCNGRRIKNRQSF